MSRRGAVALSLAATAVVGCAPTYNAALPSTNVGIVGDSMTVQFRRIEVQSVADDTVEVSILLRHEGDSPVGAACLVVQDAGREIATYVMPAEAMPGRRTLREVRWRVPVQPDSADPSIRIADPSDPEADAQVRPPRLTVVPLHDPAPEGRDVPPEMRRTCVGRADGNLGAPLVLAPGENRAGLAAMAVAAAIVLGLTLGAVGGG